MVISDPFWAFDDVLTAFIWLTSDSGVIQTPQLAFEVHARKQDATAALPVLYFLCDCLLLSGPAFGTATITNANYIGR
jgi:hypothetical protein